MRCIRALSLSACALIATSACVSAPEPYALYEYTGKQSEAPLQLPPGIQFAAQTQAKQGSVEPLAWELENHEVERHKDMHHHWITVRYDAKALWQSVTQFLQDEGILIQSQDPQTGWMQSEWLENLADLPSSFSRWLRTRLGSVIPAQRYDRYTLRVEPIDSERSAVHLTHSAIRHKKALKDSTDAPYYWDIEPRRPELEVAILNRLAAFLTHAAARAPEEQAQAENMTFTAAEPVVSASSQPDLVLNADLDTAWNWLQLALGRLNLLPLPVDVDGDGDGDGDAYQVGIRVPNIEVLSKPPSLIRRLFSEPEPEYFDWLIRAVALEQQTRIEILHAEDEQPVGVAAEPFVKALEQQLL